ncbi:hypothetical protein NESM_000191800 [Novymonas esmeraldas]|uniref:Uncharacterized protein n=1 Tax=Novymonas esmeraldas TaxID=1808958 RepID=A0AAW0F833_9TRYP
MTRAVKPPHHLKEVFRYIATPASRGTDVPPTSGRLRHLYQALHEQRNEAARRSRDACPAPPVDGSGGGGVVRLCATSPTLDSDAVHSGGLEGSSASQQLPTPAKRSTSRRSGGSRRLSVGSTELPEEQQPEGEVMHPVELEEAQSASYRAQSPPASLLHRSSPADRTSHSSKGDVGLFPPICFDVDENRPLSTVPRGSFRTPRGKRVQALSSTMGAESPNSWSGRPMSHTTVSPLSVLDNSRGSVSLHPGRRVSLQRPVFHSDDDVP